MLIKHYSDSAFCPPFSKARRTGNHPDMCRACEVEVSTSVRPCEEINAVSIIRGTAGTAYIVVVSVTKIAVNAATRAIQAVISAAVTAEPVVKVTNPSFALRAAPLGRIRPRPGQA